ncbi:MAG: 50S ribosomal protein L15 [Candidatus Omnitrophica bacterium]|nr:50S ribosomal protein L15 [Candidatus Omnitrophota bacterium]
MNLSSLKGPNGARKRAKRTGRGYASGHGKTSCKGNKGANARSGATTHIGFEGGQMPLIRRIPKRGFTHAEKEVFQVVNTEKLNVFEKNAVVGIDELVKKGLVRRNDIPVKILGTGDITIALTIKADAFSKSAKAKIEKAGGKTDIVPSPR